MATGAFRFSELPIKGGGKTVIGYVMIELAKQTIARSGVATDDVPQYGTVDFDNPTIVSERIFIDIPEISYVSEPEIGAFGADNITFQCINRLIDPVTRMSNILFDESSLHAAWHIRLRYISNEVYSSYPPSLRPWISIFQGVLNSDDAAINMPSRDDPGTWIITVSAVDCLSQLDDTSTSTNFFNRFLPHSSYSFQASNGIVLSWLEAGLPRSQQLLHIDIMQSDNQWQGFNTPSSLWFIKLRNIVQAISNSIGITAQANSGVSSGNTWEFIAFDGSSDRTFSWDELCVVSGIKTSSGPWHQEHGFFDAEGKSVVSLYNCGSALEMLKQIVIPFGMSAYIGFDAAGNRCLCYDEIQHFQSNTLPDWYIPAQRIPARRALFGMTIATPGCEDYRCGTHGDGATAIRNIFLTAAGIPNCFQWRTNPAGAYPGRCDDYRSVVRSLYAFDSNEGKVYSIYKINVRTDGRSGNCGYGQNIAAEYNHPDAARLLSIACAAYYFCPYIPASGAYYSDIGIYRRRISRIQFSVPGVLADAYHMGEYIPFQTKRWWITEKTFDLLNAVTVLTCESGE